MIIIPQLISLIYIVKMIIRNKRIKCDCNLTAGVCSSLLLFFFNSSLKCLKMAPLYILELLLHHNPIRHLLSPGSGFLIVPGINYFSHFCPALWNKLITHSLDEICHKCSHIPKEAEHLQRLPMSN